MLPSLQKKIANMSGKEKMTPTDLLEYLQQAILSLEDIIGICRSTAIAYSFNPTRSGGVDTSIFENDENVIMNYSIKLDEATSEGFVETIAVTPRQKQIATLQFYYNLKPGAGADPSLDISFDKDPTDSSSVGTWLVADERIPVIENGELIDVSMLMSKTFSIKWYIPADSTYEFVDTSVQILLVDVTKMFKYEKDLVYIAASEILQEEAAKAASEGQSEQYVGMINGLVQSYASKISEPLRGDRTPTPKVGSLKHSYDTSTHADRAFGKKKGDIPIAVIGNEATGRVIRRID
jgi:hypothetical protein